MYIYIYIEIKNIYIYIYIAISRPSLGILELPIAPYKMSLRPVETEYNFCYYLEGSNQLFELSGVGL